MVTTKRKGKVYEILKYGILDDVTSFDFFFFGNSSILWDCNAVYCEWDKNFKSVFITSDKQCREIRLFPHKETDILYEPGWNWGNKKVVIVKHLE